MTTVMGRIRTSDQDAEQLKLAKLLATASAKLAAGAALRIEEAAVLLGVARKTVEWWRYQQAHGQPAPALDFCRYGGVVRVTAASVRARMAAPAWSQSGAKIVGNSVGTGPVLVPPAGSAE